MKEINADTLEMASSQMGSDCSASKLVDVKKFPAIPVLWKECVQTALTGEN